MRKKELDKLIKSHKNWLNSSVAKSKGERLVIYTQSVNYLDFSNSDLRQAKLTWMCAHDCNFSNVNFKRAIITNSQFFKSNISFSDLSMAIISSCHFSDIDLSYTNFTGSSIHLYNSSFDKTNVYKAKFDNGVVPIVKEIASDVFYLDYFICPTSHDAELYYIIPADAEPLNDVFGIKNEILKNLLIKNIDKLGQCKNSYRWLTLRKQGASDVEDYLEYYRNIFNPN